MVSILRYYVYEEGPTQNIGSEDENTSLEKYFLKNTRCCDVNVQDVDDWLIVDDQNLI